MSEVAYLKRTDVRQLADMMVATCDDHDTVAGFFCVLNRDGTIYHDACGEMKKDTLWVIECIKRELFEEDS